AAPAAEKARLGMIRDLWRKAGEGRQAKLADLEPLLTGGDAQRGRALFFGKKVACAACHRIGQEGGMVGPDLTRIGAVRAGRDLLEAVVFPSASFAQGFDTYQIETKDGRVFTGVLTLQTAEIVSLRDSSSADFRLRKDQIQDMRRQPTSLMPEGLDRLLTRE